MVLCVSITFFTLYSESDMRKSIIFLTLILSFICSYNLSAQKVGFINSNTIREKFPEAQAAEQRVQSVVEDWKRELAETQNEIDELEFETDKNRLIWSSREKAANERKMKELLKKRESFAKVKFESGGEYDNLVKEIMKPIEEKIYAAVQKVSSEEGYDIILDQSIQPIPYVNFKYDLTIKVLKILGVETEQLEKELQDKIKQDPRNEKKEAKRPRSRKSRRSRNDPTKAQEIQEEIKEKNTEEIEKKEPTPEQEKVEKEIEPEKKEQEEQEIK